MTIVKNILSRHTVPSFNHFYQTTVSRINEQEDNMSAEKTCLIESRIQSYKNSYTVLSNRRHHTKYMLYYRDVYILMAQDKYIAR